MSSTIASASASLEPAGTSQPLSPACTSSGMPAMYVDNTGRPSANASMITVGSPSAKLGSTSARAASSSRCTCSPSIQPVMRTCAQAALQDQRLELGPQLTVAHQHELCVHAAFQRVGKGLQQQQLAFLRVQPAHGDQCLRLCRNGLRAGEQLISDPAANQSDLVPVRSRHPAPQLRGAIVTDGGS